MNEKVSCLTPEVERREKTMGCFIASFAKRLPEDIRHIAFCSPVSFRDPETDNSFHPYMCRSISFSLLKEQILSLNQALLSGIIRFLRASFGSFFYIPNRDATVLGIAPVIICKPVGNRVETSYCNSEDKEEIAWLLVDESYKEESRYPVSRVGIIRIFFKMMYFCFVISFLFKKKEDKLNDWGVASILTVRWIVSFRWVHMWIWGLKIREILDDMKPKKVYCLHEMHPHARIAWSEATHQNIPTITIQHASITRTKLWYFPTREELAAGLSTPDEIVVFSEKVQALLKPFFPVKTHFFLGCSSRFSHWKTVVSLTMKEKSKNAPILFAGSIPWWDNELILQGIKRLLKETKRTRQILIRLHPNAKISKKWKKWIDRMLRNGELLVSDGHLFDSFTQSAAVIGVNSTVLEEGALMGLAVLVIKSNNYLSFATCMGTHISLDQLTWEVIEENIALAQKSRIEYIQQARIALGIDYPVFKINTKS